MSFFLSSVRWYFVLKELSYDINFTEILFFTIGANPILTVLPFKSGEIIKAYYLSGVSRGNILKKKKKFWKNHEFTIVLPDYELYKFIFLFLLLD